MTRYLATKEVDYVPWKTFHEHQSFLNLILLSGTPGSLRILSAFRQLFSSGTLYRVLDVYQFSGNVPHLQVAMKVKEKSFPNTEYSFIVLI